MHSNLHIQTSCFVDITNFPFDKHTCSLVFGIWSYSGDEVSLVTKQTNISFDVNVIGHKEWKVVGAWSVIDNITYPCCREVYQKLTVSLAIERNSNYFAHVIVMPAVLIAMLVPFQFLLPVQSEEKVTLGK